MATNQDQNKRQELFQTMFVGILLYSVVIGFFNDYTDILHTSSYSVTFMLAIVMQILTYLTLLVKDRVKNVFKQWSHGWAKVGLVFGVWLVLFLSKFVFLAVIGFVFSDDVEISGFWGLMLIVVILTIAQRLADYIYAKLAD